MEGNGRCSAAFCESAALRASACSPERADFPRPGEDVTQVTKGGAVALPQAMTEGVSSCFAYYFKYIPPCLPCQQKQRKKKKAMENFHRFAGASCLTRTGDTLINSQVL